ncbi:MAG TPA: Rab family GTPase [Thermoplasmata archaeon]|nr:Rab family GTPase [Thermoplasmata archaeon]
MQRFKGKVCVVGDTAVGKTSLVSRYVLGEWDGRRRTTLGAKVSERGQLLDLRQFGLTLSKLSGDSALEWPPEVHFEMIVWDIMGSRGIREAVRGAYFDGARGLLAVADLTRADTLEHVPGWVRVARKRAGAGVPVVLAVNKSDRSAEAAFTEASARAIADPLEAPLLFTSAKSSENVEAAFRTLAGDVVLSLLGL